MRDIKRGKRLKEILSQKSSLSLGADETVILLGIATSSRMDHLELAHAITYKENIIPFYRKEASAEFKELALNAKKMEEIDAMLDDLFRKFSIEHKLPILDKASTT